MPAAFFTHALGPRLKYSACHWGEGVQTLAQAEVSALELTVARAQLADGQNILELGCGWGSLSLYLAERFPGSQITAVSNSNSQREFIQDQVARRGLGNLRVITRDMNQFETDERFDRVVSVEMFEHMRNYRVLFEKVAGWLVPGGRFFMTYSATAACRICRDRGPDDWMSAFLLGRMMRARRAAELHTWDGRQWAWRANTTRRRPTRGWKISTAIARKSGESWRKPTARAPASSGRSGGASSSWRARSCGVTARVRNGS